MKNENNQSCLQPCGVFCFSLFINDKTFLVYSFIAINHKHQLLFLFLTLFSPNRGEEVRVKAREVRLDCEVRGARDHQEELQARLSELAKLTNCARSDIAIKLATDMIKH